VSPFGITSLLGPVYGPPQDTTANPYITWRAYSGISSFTHPQNGHDYAVGCASDGILIVDVTANSVLGGPAVAAAVNGNWWWIPETGWSVTDILEQRTSGPTYPPSQNNPLGHLMTTDTRNREAVTFVQNGAVFLYSVNYLRPGIWVMELPPPSAWPASGSNLVPTFSAWSFVPSGPGATAAGIVGATGYFPGGGSVVHQFGGGHTISIDKAHAQIYVCGNKATVPDWSLQNPIGQFGGTMMVYNIDPVNARSLTYLATLRTTTQQAFGSWTPPAATHDVQILGNWCVVSVLDAAPPGGIPGISTSPFACWALINIANGWQGGASATMFSSLGFAPHSAWFDGRFLWGLIESTSFNLVIYDLQSPTSPPRIVASLNTPQAPVGRPAVLHHIRANGHTGFLAHYQDGLQVMDLSAGGGAVSLEQQIIANLDTSPLDYPTNPLASPFENWFQGIWDVAADFDNGIVCATQVGSPLPLGQCR